MRPAPTTTSGRSLATIGLDLARGLTPGVVAGLVRAVETAEAGTVLVVRLDGTTGAPDPWPGPVGTDLVEDWERALHRLEHLDAFTIGVLSGRGTQGALEVLLATDHRLALPDAVVELAGRPEGLWPGLGLHRLVQQAGLAGARRLALLPRDLDAAALLAAGLLDGVVPDADAEVAEIAHRLAGTEVAVRRGLLLDAGTREFEDALGAHLTACDHAQQRSAGAPDGARA
ncbi:enoyl-CoA-hydratase DpgB [Actinacidiphila acididurans]|uniref:Enoyl-CoA hydratase/isomerase family protein n=1 Tax=Actinacidiphila acididurans TaxID=2784346 RepID=A0ABS2U5D5_9ACTN|nr:enoyl-CoA-hydratase DpgB [Actinacidiphila acididurans]MBM9509921.1 enoyl-CoA hydratase/isomerase family protein [Actinacidiphila acididurans]